MRIRLILLLCVAGSLAVAVGFKTSKPTPQIQDDILEIPVDTDRPIDLKEIRKRQTTLDRLPLPGDEPPEEPEIAVTVSVDRTPNKNRLLLEFSEAHGYYVEQFQVAVWRKTDSETTLDDARFSTELFIDKYIAPNQTMTFCAPLVPAEISRAGGDMGNSEDWGAEVLWNGRARTKELAPDPLPERAIASEDCN